MKKLIEYIILRLKIILFQDLNSMHELGAKYATGYIPPILSKNRIKKAFHYYKKAALLGHPESQYDYAFMLMTGEAGIRNIEEAVKWFKISAKSGFHPAQVVLNDIKNIGIEEFLKGLEETQSHHQ